MKSRRGWRRCRRTGRSPACATTARAASAWPCSWRTRATPMWRMSQGASMRGRASAIRGFPFTEPPYKAAPIERERRKDGTMKMLRLLPLAAALGLALSGPARAEGLLEMYEQARAYDATWQSAKAQYDANLYRAEQARAGLLPQAGITGGVTRSKIDTDSPVPAVVQDRYFGTQNATIAASQPLYRPANWATWKQALRGGDRG